MTVDSRKALPAWPTRFSPSLCHIETDERGDYIFSGILPAFVRFPEGRHIIAHDKLLREAIARANACGSPENTCTTKEAMPLSPMAYMKAKTHHDATALYVGFTRIADLPQSNAAKTLDAILTGTPLAGNTPSEVIKNIASRCLNILAITKKHTFMSPATNTLTGLGYLCGDIAVEGDFLCLTLDCDVSGVSPLSMAKTLRTAAFAHTLRRNPPIFDIWIYLPDTVTRYGYKLIAFLDQVYFSIYNGLIQKAVTSVTQTWLPEAASLHPCLLLNSACAITSRWSSKKESQSITESLAPSPRLTSQGVAAQDEITFTYSGVRTRQWLEAIRGFTTPITHCLYSLTKKPDSQRLEIRLPVKNTLDLMAEIAAQIVFSLPDPDKIATAIPPAVRGSSIIPGILDHQASKEQIKSITPFILRATLTENAALDPHIEDVEIADQETKFIPQMSRRILEQYGIIISLSLETHTLVFIGPVAKAISKAVFNYYSQRPHAKKYIFAETEKGFTFTLSQYSHHSAFSPLPQDAYTLIALAAISGINRNHLAHWP